MSYVDGFIAAVPTAHREKFKKHAEIAAAIFKENGALSLAECWGDDVPEGKVTDYFRAVQARPDETIVFSWIEWPDKATRDAGMKLAFRDERLTNLDMPFDGQRVVLGGFETLHVG